MTAMAAPVPSSLTGHATPRIAPPAPARSGWKEYRDLAAKLGLTLFPWQEIAARYLTALGPADRWLYREVAIIVARQNGKTTLLVPLIVGRLLEGQRIMHTAQNATLPREIHDQVATLIQEHYPKVLPKRRGISYALGHEEINLTTGGNYRIVAPTRGGARGPSNDLVIVDELREMVGHDFIAAAKPTLTASSKPQMVYLSNAGSETSGVLNAVKSRSAEDPALAYLEWSADPERKPDDVAGWAEANPALGHRDGILETLYDDYRADFLGGTMSIFETEHLCRWVISMRERLVDDQSWQDGHVEDAGVPQRPAMAVSMDPSGERAAAAIAWQLPNDEIGLRVIFDRTGSPIDTAALGRDVKKTGLKLGTRATGYDKLTDAELAKYLPGAKPVIGAEYANASAHFASLVKAGRVKWDDADAVTEDLIWTAKKPHDQSGSYQAVRAKDDRPIPAALAAIRAVWLASGPSTGLARIY